MNEEYDNIKNVVLPQLLEEKNAAVSAYDLEIQSLLDDVNNTTHDRIAKLTAARKNKEIAILTYDIKKADAVLRAYEIQLLVGPESNHDLYVRQYESNKNLPQKLREKLNSFINASTKINSTAAPELVEQTVNTANDIVENSETTKIAKEIVNILPARLINEKTEVGKSLIYLVIGAAALVLI